MKDMRYTFVGSGGKHPGIDGITSAGNTVRLADYDEGCSVYDLFYSPFDSKLAAGDRGGFVKQFRTDAEDKELVLLAEYNQGSPLLSVSQSELCVHSVSLDRKLIVWRAPDYGGDCFESGQAQSISFESLRHKDMLVALAANGDLCVWDNEYRLMKTLPGPVPSNPLSLVRLFYWQEHDVLVYAGSDGQLVCREDSTFSCKTFAAHQTGFVTLFSDGQSLYTAGLNDGLLKRWTEPGKCESFTCEPRIVSGICLSGSESRIGLINTEGELFDCIVKDSVEVVNRKKGDFRCFMRMSGEDIAELYEQNRQRKAEILQQTILDNIEKGQLEQNVALYRELEHGGHSKACLVLQSYEGQMCQNVVVEFSAKHKLFQMVSLDGLELEFLYRYIGIALDAGLIELACDSMQHCGSVLDMAIVDYVQSLAGLTPLIVDLSSWVVVDFCDVWTIANKPVAGRVLFEQGTPLKIPVWNDSIAEIARHVSADFPDIQVTDESLLDSSGSSEIEMITFNGNVINTGSVQIVPVLLQKKSYLYFALIADVDISSVTDTRSHNAFIAKLLNEYKCCLFDIITEDQLQIVRDKIVRTLNERRAGLCQKEMI